MGIDAQLDMLQPNFSPSLRRSLLTSILVGCGRYNMQILYHGTDSTKFYTVAYILRRVGSRSSPPRVAHQWYSGSGGSLAARFVTLSPRTTERCVQQSFVFSYRHVKCIPNATISMNEAGRSALLGLKPLYPQLKARFFSFVQNVACMDCFNCGLSSFITIVYLFHIHQAQPQAGVLFQFALSHAVCPLARLLMGKDLYNRSRTVLYICARLLTVHASINIGVGLGKLKLLSPEAVLWRLLLSSLAITQLWTVLCWPLPMNAHCYVVLLSAINYLRTVPASCPAIGPQAPAASWFSCVQNSALQGLPEPVTNSTWLLFPQAKEFFWQLSVWLDLPMVHFLSGRAVSDVRAVSETALCTAVLTWTHLAVGVVGSTALVRLQSSWSAVPAQDPAGQQLSQSRSSSPSRYSTVQGQLVGIRMPTEITTKQNVWLLVASTVYAWVALWCLTRVVSVVYL